MLVGSFATLARQAHSDQMGEVVPFSGASYEETALSWGEQEGFNLVESRMRLVHPAPHTDYITTSYLKQAEKPLQRA